VVIVPLSTVRFRVGYLAEVLHGPFKRREFFLRPPAGKYRETIAFPFFAEARDLRKRIVAGLSRRGSVTHLSLAHSVNSSR
jgi:hypothetical protein